MKKTIYLILVLLCCSFSLSTQAQNTFGITQGWGSGSIRSYPSIEDKSLYGLWTTSLQWRNYTATRSLGCFGIDLEFMQRGFAYAPYTTTNNTDGDKEESDLLYYKRYINSIMLPIIWQPYVYMFHNKVRVFGDAAVTLSYNISSTYENDLYHDLYPTDDTWQGEYNMRTERDNTFMYGLAFGGGISYLFDRLEVQASMRYYFGYSDIMKNRQKYYTNSTDSSAENPFSYTPMRSPIDNFNFKIGVNYRIGKEDGFAAWHTERLKNSGLRDGFGYEEQSGTSSQTGNNSNNSRGNNNAQQRNNTRR